MSTLFTIYIGLKDADTNEQKFKIERYQSVLRDVCRSYGVAFSVQVVGGGYFYKNGCYTDENTLQLQMTDISEETVTEIAKDLCAFFNQESVIVVSQPCTVKFVSEKL